MTARPLHATVASITARQREQAQGQARQSRVRFFVVVTGVGETRLQGTQAVSFGCFMMEEPTFNFGCTAIGSLPEGALPMATATVLNYSVNAQGLYTAAEMGFKVESAKYDIRLRFSLTFEGIALRTTAGLTPT